MNQWKISQAIIEFELNINRIYDERIAKEEEKITNLRNSKHDNKDIFTIKSGLTRLKKERERRLSEILLLRRREKWINSALYDSLKFTDIISQHATFTIQNLEIFDHIAFTCHYSHIFLSLLPEIHHTPDQDLLINKLDVLFKPKDVTDRYLSENFKWCRGLKLFGENNVRYLPNVSYKSLSNLITTQQNLLKKVTDKTNGVSNPLGLSFVNQINDTISVGSMLRQLFHKMAGQQRFGNHASNIFALSYVKQRLSEASYQCNLPSEDTFNCTKQDTFKVAKEFYCFNAIMAIVKHYNGLPYYSKKRPENSSEEINVKKGSDCSLVLPIVVTALLNGTLAELLGDLNYNNAQIYVQNIISSLSHPSFVQGQLYHRKEFRKYVTLVYDRFKYIPYVSRNALGFANEINIVRTTGEFFESSESKQKMMDDFRTIKDTTMGKFYSHCFKIADTLSNKLEKYALNFKFQDDVAKLESESDHKIVTHVIEWLRYITMLSNTLTNFGTFNKTSLILDFQKSTGTVFNRYIENVPIKDVVVTNDEMFPLSFYWEKSIFRNLYIRFKTLWEPLIAKNFGLENNFENFFVLNLTNRSGGDKTVDVNLPDDLQHISNARMVSFLLQNQKYYNPKEFLELLTAEGRCWVRHQIDRRGRIIVIVPNAVQSSDIFLLHAFNTIKKDRILGKSMAVGKQVGNILDANSQLVASGDWRSIKNSSDMSGMDAHTIPIITKFLRYLMIDCLESDIRKNTINSKKLHNNVSNGYFTGSRGSVGILQYLEGKELSGLRELTPESMHVARTLNSLWPRALTLKSDVNATKLNVSDQTFMSGFFATSGQHTSFLDLLIGDVTDQISINVPRINVETSIMGDDVFQVIQNGAKYPNEATKYLTKIKAELENFNYEIDTSYSKYVGQFLQQVALLGVYVPLPMRVGVFCDEKSETLFRNPVDVMKIMADISMTRAQRSYAIDNIISLGPAIWNSIRVSRMFGTSSEIASMERAITKNKLEHLNILNKLSDDTFLLSYPYFCVHTAPINWPLFSILVDRIHKDGTVIHEHCRQQCVTTLGGSSSKSFINNIFYKSRGPLGVTFNDSKPHLPVIDNFIDWEQRNYYGFTISEYVNGFHRMRRLSEIRVSKVKLEIDNMAAALDEYMDRSRLDASRHASEVLRARSINIPYGLLYCESSKGKIIQALESRLESLDEQTRVDRAFINYFNSYSIIPSPTELREHELTCFSIDYNYLYEGVKDRYIHTKIEIDNDRRINMIVPIMPGYHQHSDYGLLYNFVGRPYMDSDDRVAIGEITSILSGSFDIDSAVDFGIRVYYRDSALLPTLSIAYGIPEDKSILFEDLVKKWANYGYRTRYQSIFKPSLFFAINGDLTTMDTIIDYKQSKFLSRVLETKLQPLLRAWSRDLLYMYVRYLPLQTFPITAIDFCIKRALNVASLKYSNMRLSENFEFYLML